MKSSLVAVDGVSNLCKISELGDDRPQLTASQSVCQRVSQWTEAEVDGKIAANLPFIIDDLLFIGPYRKYVSIATHNVTPTPLAVL